MLLCDFGNLSGEVQKIEAAGLPALHLDVMDGVFVPNLTYGMTIVQAARRLTDLPLDVHLMITQPQNYVSQFFESGADVITIHREAVQDPRPVLESILNLGAAAGIAINPLTPVSQIENCLDLVDLVLVMSVQAGFGGQSFNPIALKKLKEIRELPAGRNVLLEIDGGINVDTVAMSVRHGAQLLVAGSAIFCQADYGAAIRQLRAEIEECENS
jgi:ribulose-phosphate 3-epimerase